MTNTTEIMWASIPADLLWMIKDKLDIFDDTHLTVVCRNWYSASASYPKKQSTGGGVPWLMQKKEGCRNAWEFISVAAKKKFTMDMGEEFQRFLILYSKDGWFLMKERYVGKEEVVFMMNPFTKTKIKLPHVDSLNCAYFGTFSTREGYPHCVVLLLVETNDLITIKIAYPGDKLWSNYSYRSLRCSRSINQLLTISEHVYCSDVRGGMFVYNMSTQKGKEVLLPIIGRTNLIEFEGHVVQVVREYVDEFREDFSFFKYNDRIETSWEKLNMDDVKDTSWFLSNKGDFCYCTKKQEGLKIYRIFSKFNSTDFFSVLDSHISCVLARKQHGVQRTLMDNTRYKVVVYEVMDGSKEILDFPYQVCTEVRWVDI